MVAPSAVSSASAKPSFFKGGFDAVYAYAVIVCNKGRGNAGVNLRARLNHYFNFFGFFNYLFSVLRADDEALPAKNTLVTDNMRLIARKSYRFNGAVTYTFITVFAV